MTISAGDILLATQSMDDPQFANSMVLLVECNEEGAVGLVINKFFDRSLNALAEFSQSPALPLYAGGPVDTEHLFFIHRRPDLVPDSQAVTRDIYYGGNFKKAIDYINRQMLMEEDIKICIGYCGWDSGDLEAEIAEGSWRIKEANADVVFSRCPTI